MSRPARDRSSAPVRPSDSAPPATGETAGGLGLVASRPLFATPVEARFDLRPGDHALVTEGETVVRGTVLADRLRDPRTEVVAGPSDPAAARPGHAWTLPTRRREASGASRSGELLFQSGGRWRIGIGQPDDPLEAPFAGLVRTVRPGMEIRLAAPARMLLGREVLAGPSSGRLSIIAARDGEVRASEIDVDDAGAILVAGAHADAETITRARAVGVRGIVVAALGMKERRDVLASESRSRAAAHGLPPFAVLVLDGAARRPIASPVMAVLEALAGRTVAIVADPPGLVFDPADDDPPTPPADFVRVVAGPLAGGEGRWAGLAGPIRFPGGVVLEAGLVSLTGRAPVAVPLGDLERFT